MPSRPSPGSDPGPVQVPSWVRRGPVQIRHVLYFTAFRAQPVLVPSRSRAFLPGSGLDKRKQTSWPLPSLVLHFANRWFAANSFRKFVSQVFSRNFTHNECLSRIARNEFAKLNFRFSQVSRPAALEKKHIHGQCCLPLFFQGKRGPKGGSEWQGRTE